MGKLVLLIIVLVTHIYLSEGDVKCYSCNYPDPKCEDTFGYRNPDALDCAGFCMKRRGKRNGITEVYRGCVLQADVGCRENVDYLDIKVTECFCDENYCNDGSQIKVSILGIFIAAATILYHML